MQPWLRLASGIDRVNEHVGRAMFWLTLLMVLIGAYNAIVRYLDRFTGIGLSSNTYIELEWYLFGLAFMLAAAYTLRHDAHVRVDVLFARLSPKGRAWINLAGTVLFLIPFCALVVWLCWRNVAIGSWSLDEMSADAGGLPRFPIRIAIPVAFILLAMQGVSLIVKQIAILTGNLAEDEVIAEHGAF